MRMNMNESVLADGNYSYVLPSTHLPWVELQRACKTNCRWECMMWPRPSGYPYQVNSPTVWTTYSSPIEHRRHSSPSHSERDRLGPHPLVPITWDDNDRNAIDNVFDISRHRHQTIASAFDSSIARGSSKQKGCNEISHGFHKLQKVTTQATVLDTFLSNSTYNTSNSWLQWTFTFS